MELTFWLRAISLGALTGAAVLVVTACSSPPESEPVTDVEPALSEAVLSDEEQHDEPRPEERESEFVDPEPTSTVDPAATPAPDPDVEKESEFVDPEPTSTVDPTATPAADPHVEKESEFVDPEPTSTADPTATPTPDPDMETERVVDDPETEASVDVVAVETEAHGLYDDFYGAAVASIEERIFLSDVIVRAVLVSVGNDLLHFRALEYLMGTGPKDFSVAAKTEGRDTSWDDHEAVLFLLDRGMGSASFDFADTTTYLDYRLLNSATAIRYKYAGDLPPGDTIGANNPVWLPAESAASSDTFITAATSVSGEPLPTITLGDLRAKIEWVRGSGHTPTGGTIYGVEDYEYCIRASLDYMRSSRDWEEYHGQPHEPSQFESQVRSGAPGGTAIHEYGTRSWPGYDRVWVSGGDAELFTAQIIDDDDDPTNGFAHAVLTARPLPAGTYRVISHGQAFWYQPCNFTTQFNFLEWIVTVIAPEGTVHEALFDPADLPSGTGFSSRAGSLASAEFSVAGTATTVTDLRWGAGSLILTLDPFVDLDGHHLQIISLDGSIDLSLAASSATADTVAKTLTWAVVDRPWKPGDQLMLRIWSPPETASPVPTPAAETISASWGFTCRLEADGLAVCWGRNDDGQSSPPPGERFVAISAGNSHVCGLRADRVVVCWGGNGAGQSSPPEDGRFVAISTGWAIPVVCVQTAWRCAGAPTVGVRQARLRARGSRP